MKIVSRVFVLFVCDAFLSGVIRMHLFLFKTDIWCYPFQIFFREFFVEFQLIQTLYFPSFSAMLDDDFSLVEIDVRVGFQAFYAGFVEVHPEGIPFLHGKPGG